MQPFPIPQPCSVSEGWCLLCSLAVLPDLGWRLGWPQGCCPGVQMGQSLLTGLLGLLPFQPGNHEVGWLRAGSLKKLFSIRLLTAHSLPLWFSLLPQGPKPTPLKASMSRDDISLFALLVTILCLEHFAFRFPQKLPAAPSTASPHFVFFPKS